MTLHPTDQWLIPAETAKVARAAFPKGNVYMKMRDALGQLYYDHDFATLFRADCGKVALSPGQLALITVMQFAEGLTDRQAADQVRARLDWKYALALELTDSGFNYSVLSEFRHRLIARGRESQLLDDMLKQFQQQDLLKARGKQRTDSTHVLAAIRQLNRVEVVGESLRHALNVIASVAPEWLLAQVTPDWFDRYSFRFEQFRLPKAKEKLEQLALRIGEDGHQLLSAVYAVEAPKELRQLPAVEILRQVWVQQYYLQGEQLLWRKTDQLPPNQQLIQSPYDPEARNRTKRNTNWTGYTVHLTETCDEEMPNLITHVETTPATTHDGALTQKIHAALEAKELLPAEHLVDTSYVDAEHLVTSQQDYDIDLIGPVPPDPSWQAKAQAGFDISCFAIDWEALQVICPTGRLSQSWHPRTDEYGNPVIEVRFEPKDCRVCASKEQCTRSKNSPRMLKFRLQEPHLALQAARTRQTTDEFKRLYATRAGVEGTLSQGMRSFNLRRSYYIGLAKTHLQHVATAAAMNLSRFLAWLEAVPKATTRTSAFAAIAPTA